MCLPLPTPDLPEPAPASQVPAIKPNARPRSEPVRTAYHATRSVTSDGAPPRNVTNGANVACRISATASASATCHHTGGSGV